MKKQSTKTVAVSLALTAALACPLFAGCSSTEQTQEGSDAAAEQKDEQATQSEAGAPLEASQIEEGTYEIEVESSSNMFKIVKAELTVADGSMTCAMTLSGDGYGKLFMGTSDEAAQATEEQCYPFVVGEDGAYTYTVPVEQLNVETPCAAWSLRKEQWYDRTLIFQSDNIPADKISA